jgi:hypothetical protein
MVKTKPKTVEEVLDKVEEDKKTLAEKLCVLIKKTVPKAEETVRRGRITFTLGGKDFAGVRLTKQHVDLLFIGGANLSSAQLKGQGTIGDPKHLEVYSFEKMDENETKRLLREAASTSTL